MVHAAHELLRGHSVGEVAGRAGMGHSAFARAFREVHGVAPKRFQLGYRPGSTLETTLEQRKS